MIDAALSVVSRRMRAAALVIGLVVSSLALIASLLLTTVTMWLQTAAGERWLERALAQQVSDRLALRLTVGRISGSFVRGIRLEHVALHDAQGRLVARADALSARYRLRRLVRLHEVDEIALVRPVIVQPPAASGAPAPSFGRQTTFSVRHLKIRDGALRWRGHDVRHLSASLAIDYGRSGARGHRFDGGVDLILDDQPLGVRAEVELAETRVDISAELHGASFVARGHGAWANGRLAATLESLDVNPTLLAAKAGWAGRGALHAHATMAGPLDALDLKLQGHTANRALALGALIDARRRTADATAFVATPSRGLGVQARGALHGRGLDLTTLEARSGATRLHGAAHADARGIRGAFDAEVAPAEAALLRIHPAAPIRLRVALRGPPRALDVRVDGRLRTAHVTLAGRLDLAARRGQLRFIAHDVRPLDIVPKAPPLAFSGAFTFDGALRANVGLAGDMTVRDGSLEVEGARFDRLQGTARVRLGQPGDARIDALSGRLLGRRARPIAVQTVVHWDRRALRFNVASAMLEHSRATGDVVYTEDRVEHKDRVVVRAATLSLSPSLIEEALHWRPSQAWPGRGQLVWTPGHYQVGFALDTDQGPASGEARIRTDRGALELSSIVVALGASRLRGAARVKHGVIAASVDELVLAPELIQALWPELSPVRRLRIQGAAAGPLRRLELRLVATAGPSAAIVRGLIDVPARSFRLLAALDAVRPNDLEQTKAAARLTLELALNGRVVDGGIAGTLTVRHAQGTLAGMALYRGRLDAHLDGPSFQLDQLLLDLPGVTLHAKGGGTYRDFRIGYGVVITDALELRQMPGSLRVMVGLSQLVPGPTVVGSIERHNGGKLDSSHRTILPGLRWFVLLYDLVRGRLPKLTVH